MPRIQNNPTIASCHIGHQTNNPVPDNAVGQSICTSGALPPPGTANEAHPLSERSTSLTTKQPETIRSGGSSITLSKQLQHAVKEGNLETLRALHNDGLDIAAQTVTGFMTIFNPLACAAENKNLETFRFLAKATRQPLDNPGQLLAQLIFSLIKSDQWEYLDVLHSNGLLHEVICRDLIDGDVNDMVYIDNKKNRIPMLNLAISFDSQKVFKWLLDKEFDPTKTGINIFPPEFIRNCNAFELAAMQSDGKMLEHLLIHFRKTAKPAVLPQTRWLQIMARYYKGDSGFKEVLVQLPRFHNGQELVSALIDAAYQEHNIILLTDLIDTFGEESLAEKDLARNFALGVKNKDPERILYLIRSDDRIVEIVKLLQFISTLPDSDQLFERVLQRLKDLIPNSILNLILQSSFASCVDNNAPQFLNRSTKYWTLITALIRHGAKADPLHMLSYAVITGNMELLRQSLNELPEESEQLKDCLTTMAENLVCKYHYAKSPEALMLLIDRGADSARVMRTMMMDSRKHKGMSDRNFGIMKSLLAKNGRLVDLTIDKRNGESLLEFTLCNQYFREAKFLIQFGADISQPTSYNLTLKEAVVKEINHLKSKGKKVDEWKQILSLLKKQKATAH